MSNNAYSKDRISEVMDFVVNRKAVDIRRDGAVGGLTNVIAMVIPILNISERSLGLMSIFCKRKIVIWLLLREKNDDCVTTISYEI